MYTEEHRRPHLTWCGSQNTMPQPRVGEVGSTNRHVGIDRYSRIMVEYLTYAFMGNTRDITGEKSKKKKLSKTDHFG